MTLTLETTETFVANNRDRRVLASLFAIDTRALAAVRIGLSLLILFEAVIIETLQPRAANSLFGWVVEYWGLLILPSTVMLLLGIRTRMATVITWIIYTLPIRSALLDVTQSVDLGRYILALMLFWGIFLPLGHRWSTDSSKGQKHPRARYLSIGSGAVLFQLGIIYVFAGISKDVGEWVLDATALETIFQIPQFSTSLGLYMTRFPTLLGVMSVATIALEVIGTILLFVPGRTLVARRTIIASSFIAFHLGIVIFMGIGLFPFVLMVAWLVFMPTEFWDRLQRLKATNDSDVPVHLEKSSLLNITAITVFVFVFVSNLFTWFYYPSPPAFAAIWQQVGRYFLLYQQWAMFAVPSSI